MALQESIYDPGIAAFGGGSTGSVLHPAIIAFVGVVALLTFTLKRKYLVAPLLLGLLVIPGGQNLYIGGFHVFMYRLVVLIGWARVGTAAISSPRKLLPGGFNVLDKVFLIWAFYRALATVLLYREFGAVANQIGFLWDSIGAYFLLRALIEDEDDILRAVKVLLVVGVIAFAGMIYEQVTLQNLFASLGGIRATPEIREGRIRSQGVFGHALLAGAYGATVFGLFLWWWKKTKNWFFPLVGAVVCLGMVYLASTSTPLIALMSVFLAIGLWPIRKHMRELRWSLVLALVGLHMVMKAPVWFVLGHIDLSGGSTGEHRALLIDNFIRHFFDWCLIGTHDYVNWGWYMYDQCNQYILEGENGGLIAFSCFIAMFCICYRWIGEARKASVGDKNREWLFWILGATFFAQTMAFFGIDYFDQMKAVWYLILVIVTVSTQFARDPAFAPAISVTEQGPRFAIQKLWQQEPAGESRLARSMEKSSSGFPEKKDRRGSPARKPKPALSGLPQWRKR